MRKLSILQHYISLLTLLRWRRGLRTHRKGFPLHLQWKILSFFKFLQFLSFIIIPYSPLSLFGLRIHSQGLKAKFLGHCRAEGKSKCFLPQQTMLFILINNACFLLIISIPEQLRSILIYGSKGTVYAKYFLILRYYSRCVVGCGKTTLLKVMVGKLKLDSGKVRSFPTKQHYSQNSLFWGKILIEN
jgi:hypothetical protein